jgi:GNAT superfamily N-acetyltransferase
VIRPATPADAPRLFSMALRFLHETIYARLAPPEPSAIVALIETVLARGVVFVDERDGELIGMLGLAALLHILTGRPYADEIVWWVEPEHRKTRAAYYLLGAGEEWARQNNLSVLKMVAPAGSAIGKFYESRGYELVESAYQKVITP